MTKTVYKRKKTIEQVDVANKRVLMRVDFNVPLNRKHEISDDRRIRLAVESIRSVISRGGICVLMSHLGRPGGIGPEPGLSLKTVVEHLKELMPDASISMAPGACDSPEAAAAVEAAERGSVIVLENLRFNSGEKAGARVFSEKLAKLGDIYCNNAFGTAHRSDASMVAVPELMQGKPRVAGFLLQQELVFLSDALEDAASPFVAVLGGAKVSDKLMAIQNLLGKVDVVLIGGAMAYTFLQAIGRGVGESLVEEEMLDQAERLIDAAAASTTELMLPRDHVAGKEIEPRTSVEVFADEIEAGWMGLDIGPETAGWYTDRVRHARTVLWNGPVGVYEIEPFDVGTRQIAEACAAATEQGAVTVLGGGDTAAAIKHFGLSDQVSHVSTGGGASLELLEGKKFRSVELLDDE